MKSAWTQYNPPSVSVIDDRLVDPEFKIQQPDKIDTKAIAAKWKENNLKYAEAKEQQMSIIMDRIASGEIDEAEADFELEQWVKENRHNYEVKGIAVTQEISVRYR